MKCLCKLHSDSGLMENTKGRYVIHYVALPSDKFKFYYRNTDIMDDGGGPKNLDNVPKPESA